MKKKLRTVDGINLNLIPCENLPALGEIVAEVNIVVPASPFKKRQATLEFLAGIEKAFGVRSALEGELFLEDLSDGGIVIKRRKQDGDMEIKYIRTNLNEATLYCDARELKNLVALGFLPLEQVLETLKKQENK